MKNTFLIILLCSSATIFAQDAEKEIENVKKEITDTYLKPLYAGGSLDNLKAGLPEEFDMYVLYKGELSKSSKKIWMDKMTEVRSRPKKPGPKAKNTWKFIIVDVTGQTAMAKIEVYRDGDINFTDYLTLYKFEEEGWKLLSKFFTFHNL
jgi:NADPH-dependent 2,4-dienoyl-CoA reductase/sulfur reductase-like enzyme